MELLAFGKTGWGDELFVATLMTVAVSLTAMIIGFLFALIFTPLKLSKNKFLNLIGNFYTTVIRGVPELLVIYLFFFGGSGAVMFVASIFGYNDYIEINAFITGSCAIGIISGAYSTEVFRGALQSIDRGQYEASKVLGIKKGWSNNEKWPDGTNIDDYSIVDWIKAGEGISKGINKNASMKVRKDLYNKHFMSNH